MFIRNDKKVFFRLHQYHISGPNLLSLWIFTITVVNQFCNFSHKLNFSNLALVIPETNGINEITLNHIMDYTFVAPLIQIQVLNYIFFHVVICIYIFCY